MHSFQFQSKGRSCLRVHRLSFLIDLVHVTEVPGEYFQEVKMVYFYKNPGGRDEISQKHLIEYQACPYD